MGYTNKEDGGTFLVCVGSCLDILRYSGEMIVWRKLNLNFFLCIYLTIKVVFLWVWEFFSI